MIFPAFFQKKEGQGLDWIFVEMFCCSDCPSKTSRKPHQKTSLRTAPLQNAHLTQNFALQKPSASVYTPRGKNIMRSICPEYLSLFFGVTVAKLGNHQEISSPGVLWGNWQLWRPQTLLCWVTRTCCVIDYANLSQSPPKTIPQEFFAKASFFQMGGISL